MQRTLNTLSRCHSSQGVQNSGVHCNTIQTYFSGASSCNHFDLGRNTIQWKCNVLQTVFYCTMHTVHIVHNCALHSAVQRCLHWAPRLAIAGHADSPGIVHINHLQTCFCTTTPFELTDHTNAAFFPFLHFAQNLTSSLSIPIPKFNLNQTPDAFKPQFSRQSLEAILRENAIN